MPFASHRSLRLVVASLAISACASSSAAPQTAAAPSPDPRLHLRAGWLDGGQAEWNMRLIGAAKPSAPFFNPTGPSEAVINTDLAFTSHYVVQGNFGGFQIWDVNTPSAPRVVAPVVCGGIQGDVSVHRNLLFVSVEAASGRLDCGLGGIKDSVSAERFRGVRIFDISDVDHPKKVADVQTCRGSHTHTLVTDPADPTVVYVYVSAVALSRSPTELAGCSDLPVEDDPNTSRFRIDVIRVPLAHPEQAAVIAKPALLADLPRVVRHSEYTADSAAVRALRQLTDEPAGAAPAKHLAVVSPVTATCHDITVYSAVGLAAGACVGYGLLLDIHDPANPRRLAAAGDTNFWAWHSATFNNDGSAVLFSDEWGAGYMPRCRATDNPKWGADAIYRIDGSRLILEGYYKLPVAQTAVENCVAHNGSLIPIPGRTVMVQAWYQGGISVFDWTDPAHAEEIAYFDRGPVDSTKLVLAGSFSAYWYNGYIYSSEIGRGLDVLQLQASPLLTQNEIDAATSVHFGELNVQDQPRFVWPATWALARAYLDQLARDNGLPSSRRAVVARALAQAEHGAGDARRRVLMTQATLLRADAGTSPDAAKVNTLADVLSQLAGT